MRTLLLTGVLCVLLGAILHLTGGSTLYARYPASDGRGTVELVMPARWQALQVADYEIPVAARYIERDGIVIGPSATFDLVGNARLRWDEAGVSIGTVATYDRRSRRWSVEE